jgi:hypothetical protein
MSSALRSDFTAQTFNSLPWAQVEWGLTLLESRRRPRILCVYEGGTLLGAGR